MKGIMANLFTGTKTKGLGSFSFNKPSILNYNQVNQNKEFGHHFKSAENLYQSSPVKQSSLDNKITNRKKINQKPSETKKLNLSDSDNVQKNIELNSDKQNKTHKIDELLKKEIESVFKKVSEKIKKLDSNKNIETSTSVHQNEESDWESLINLLQKLIILTTKEEINSENNQKVQTVLTKLKNNGNNLDNPSNILLLKEMKSFINEWRDFVKVVNNDKAELFTNKKAMLENILSDLQKLFENKIQNVENSKFLLSTEKIAKGILNTPVQQGIQLIPTKNKQKTEISKENISQDQLEVQSVNQKSEVKSITMSEMGDGTKSEFTDSKGKFTTNSRGLSLQNNYGIKNPNNLFDQIVNKASMISNNRRSEMWIKLEPQVLGNVQIKIVVERGIVSGQFLVDSQTVKNFLEENLGVLKESLESQGLEFDEINISLGERKQNSYFEKEAQLSQLAENQSKNIHENIIVEETFSGRYKSADWLAKEVDLVV